MPKSSSRKSTTRRLITWLEGRSKSEKTLIAIAAAAVLLIAITSVVSQVSEWQEETERLAAIRKRQHAEIASLLQKYHTLNTRLESLKRSFDESQMSFEQVTEELDRIVQKHVGSASYDLKKNQNPEPLGSDFEKQAFTLRIPSVTLEQLVDLLYEIEHGKAPLFMGKVDIIATRDKKSFRVTLAVSSINRKNT